MCQIGLAPKITARTELATRELVAGPALLVSSSEDDDASKRLGLATAPHQILPAAALVGLRRHLLGGALVIWKGKIIKYAMRLSSSVLLTVASPCPRLRALEVRILRFARSFWTAGFVYVARLPSAPFPPGTV
jgi:hypothetical protein